MRTLLVLASVVCAAGCAKHPRFDGTWTYQSGSSTRIACAGASPKGRTLFGTITITAAGDGAIDATFSDGGCTFRYALLDGRAAIVADQKPAGDCAGQQRLLASAHDTFSLEGEGLAERASGTTQFLGMGGAPTSCQYTLRGTLRRAP